ncbi:hypothetical protein Dimus_007242 [Dionaea muscipula]
MRQSEIIMADGGDAPAPQNLLVPAPQVFGTKTDAQKQAEINEALEPLHAIGVRTDLFTVQAINNLGLTTKRFLRDVRNVVQIRDNALLAQIWNAGVQAQATNIPAMADINAVLGFARWLKSAAGQQVMRQTMKRKKLQARAQRGLTMTDTALNVKRQRQDYLNVVKIEREGFENQLRDLRMQIKRVEMERDARLLAIAAEFRPASEFLEPSAGDISDQHLF